MLRRALAVVLIALGVVLTPVATVAGWARVALVDTDRFVGTLAPLADDPDVRDLVAERATAAIVARLDADALLDDVFTSLAALDLPPRAQEALPLLRASVVAGLEGLISRTVADVVSSERFGATWTTMLRASHTAAVALLTRDGGGIVGVGDDGGLELQVDAVIAAARQRLIDEGVPGATLIPEVSLTVSLGQADTVLTARAVYRAAVAAGVWLPWAALVLVVTGIVLAPRRGRAVVWSGGAVALVSAVALVAIALGRAAFVDAAGADAAAAAAAIYSVVVASLATALGVLTLVGAAGAATAALLLLRRRALPITQTPSPPASAEPA